MPSHALLQHVTVHPPGAESSASAVSCSFLIDSCESCVVWPSQCFMWGQVSGVLAMCPLIFHQAWPVLPHPPAPQERIPLTATTAFKHLQTCLANFQANPHSFVGEKPYCLLSISTAGMREGPQLPGVLWWSRPARGPANSFSFPE